MRVDRRALLAIPLIALPAALDAGSDRAARQLLARIHWLASTHEYGGACVRIDGPPVVYIDPSSLPEPARQPKADLILVTHAHSDHFSPETIAGLAQPTTRVVTIPTCVASLRANSATRDLALLEIHAGERQRIGDVAIEAVPAYNLEGEVHPRAAGGVGFLLTVRGVRVYHSGDTSVTPEMRALRKIDIAFLTLRPTYMMSGAEVVEALRAFHPHFFAPIHWLDAERSELQYVQRNVPPETHLIPLAQE